MYIMYIIKSNRQWLYNYTNYIMRSYSIVDTEIIFLNFRSKSEQML